MRYQKGHKDETRRRVLDIAARRFRRDGVKAVGVASVMADAGLTHGGFYAHFPSKQVLIAAALVAALRETRSRLERVTLEAGGEEGGVEAFIRAYLAPLHRDRPDKGCAAAALTAEIARAPRSTRAAFTDEMRRFFGQIEALLPDTAGSADRRHTAMAIFATLMGSLQLARAMSDGALSDQMLEAGATAALALARGPQRKRRA